VDSSIRGAARSRAALFCLACLGLATALRLVWLTADPPTHATVGIVWHDEGAWVHNARNRALWGTWRTDEWNPMFLTPVFTGLEYAAFELLGVGTWQARVVPAVSGIGAVALLALGLGVACGARAAMAGALLLATNYVFVMWNRAALMESTMTAFIVGSWCAYAAARRWPKVGLLAGLAAVAAWFTKASAAFFIPALAGDCLITLGLAWSPAIRRRLAVASPEPAAARAAVWTLVGLAATAAVAILLFVAPHWSEYRFYNWQMSVTRKPAYTVKALMDRASWLPIVHDFFTRMWLVLGVAALGLVTIASRWRTAAPWERLLGWWVLLGLLELIVHDSGNERRYVMFVPALVALAAAFLGRGAVVEAPPTRFGRWALLPLMLLLAYLVLGSVIRLAFLYEVRPGVRLSAAAALALVAVLVLRWERTSEWFARQRLAPRGVALVVGIAAFGDLAQYVQWAANRSDANYRASIELGRVLAPGTLVQGKLANGLALENRIRPLFIGHGFGNFDDRKTRDDVRYILTYIYPYVGYEGSQILDVLGAYPNRKIIMTFDVAETASGHDRAALIDKFGAAIAHGQTIDRATH
jgi:hypothetical protein